MGPKSLGLIINDRSNAEEQLRLLYAKPQAYTNICVTEKLAANVNKFKNEHTPATYFEWMESKGWRAVLVDSSAYPRLLKQMTNAPWVLYEMGAPVDWSAAEPLAVIGSRQMTAYGRLAVKWLVPKLASSGCLIVSGAMVGVDLAAHQAALEAGQPTVGFLGYGFQWVYPPQIQDQLADLIKQGGTLISQFPPWTPPAKGNFIARNQVVAGVSRAILVVEAAAVSGTFSTVHWALEEGREVLAVPGPITSPYSEGTKLLLNQGAQLVSSASDVWSALGQNSPTDLAAADGELSLTQMISEILRAGPVTLDQLGQLTARPTSELSAACTQLEISGQVVRIGGRLALARVA